MRVARTVGWMKMKPHMVRTFPDGGGRHGLRPKEEYIPVQCDSKYPMADAGRQFRSAPPLMGAAGFDLTAMGEAPGTYVFQA